MEENSETRTAQLTIPDLIDRNPTTLDATQIAEASRPPLTMIGNRLRETNASGALGPAQSLVLSQLMAADSLPITELAAADGRAISTMTEIVGRLVTAGWVEKRDGVEDRRQVRVSITPSGQRALKANQALRNQTLTERIATLEDHERIALASALPALWKLAELDFYTWPKLPARTARPSHRKSTPTVKESKTPRRE